MANQTPTPASGGTPAKPVAPAPSPAAAANPNAPLAPDRDPPAEISALEGDQNSTNQDSDLFESTGEPIESIVVKKFTTELGAVLEPGQSHLYQPVEGRPYPWPLIRPKDEKLAKELEADWNDYQDEKIRTVLRRATAEDVVRALARSV